MKQKKRLILLSTEKGKQEMKKLAATLTLALTVGTSAASAADYSNTASKSDPWTGFYGGVGVMGAFDSAGEADFTMLGGYGELGADYQIGNFVMGVSGIVSGGYFDLEYNDTDIVDGSALMVTGLGRAGFAFDNVLVYAAGGYGWLELCAAGCVDGDDALFGGGVEWKAGDNWSIKGEALFDTEGTPYLRSGVNLRF